MNLTHISPFFIVGSLATSIAFYLDKLNFKIQYIMPGNAPFFAIVARDNISIMLKEIATEIKPVPNHMRHQWARWDAFIHATNPDQLFDEYRAKDVVFHQTIKDDDDGLRGFAVTDADGYVLFFGRPVVNVA